MKAGVRICVDDEFDVGTTDRISSETCFESLNEELVDEGVRVGILGDVDDDEDDDGDKGTSGFDDCTSIRSSKRISDFTTDRVLVYRKKIASAIASTSMSTPPPPLEEADIDEAEDTVIWTNFCER